MVHNAKEIIATIFLISIIIPIGISMLSNNPISCYTVIYDVPPTNDVFVVYGSYGFDAEYAGQYVNSSNLNGIIVNKIDIYLSRSNIDLPPDNISFEVGIFDYPTNQTLVSFGTFNAQDISIYGQTYILEFINDFNYYSLDSNDFVGIKMLFNDNPAESAHIEDTYNINNPHGGNAALVYFDNSRQTFEGDYSMKLYTKHQNCDTVNNLIIIIPLLALVVLIIIILYKALNDRD